MILSFWGKRSIFRAICWFQGEHCWWLATSKLRQCEVHGLLEEVQTLSSSLEVPKKKLWRCCMLKRELWRRSGCTKTTLSSHNFSMSPQKSQSIFSLREELPRSSSTEFQSASEKVWINSSVVCRHFSLDIQKFSLSKYVKVAQKYISKTLHRVVKKVT